MCQAYRASLEGAATARVDIDVKAVESQGKISELPKTGDILKWNGHSKYHLDSVQRVLNANWGGILHPRRPLLPLLDAQTGLVKPEAYALELEKPFAVGWYGCPVFLARVRRREAPEPAEQVEDERVVIKLMYFDTRERGENIDMDDYNFLEAKQLVAFAKAEADAYAALEKGQGSVLPYCYGFYEVRYAQRHLVRVLRQAPRSLPLRMAIDASAKFSNTSAECRRIRSARPSLQGWTTERSAPSYVAAQCRLTSMLTAACPPCPARKPIPHPYRAAQSGCTAQGPSLSQYANPVSHRSHPTSFPDL
jgi:hypothetical protein